MQLYATFVAPGESDLARALHDSPDRFFEIARDIPIIKFGYRTGSGFGFTMIASAFVHDGWFHLVGNMLFLWLAGSAVEDRWGHVRFAVFYFAGAIAAVYAFELMHEGPQII